MKLEFFGLKTCDTCRKAFKALEAAGHTVSNKDVREDGVSKSQITKWAKAVGWETLLNTRSTTWRGLDDSDKDNINQANAIALMVEHPTLIKRPVIEEGNTLTVGWTKAVQDRFL